MTPDDTPTANPTEEVTEATIDLDLGSDFDPDDLDSAADEELEPVAGTEDTNA